MLKNTLIACSMMLLSACASVASFDNNEYKILVDIRFGSLAFQEFCPTAQIYPMVNSLYNHSKTLIMYAEHKPNNTDSLQLYKKLDAEIEELHSAYFNDISKFPSITYCKLKLENITNNAEVIQKSVGKRVK